MLSTDRYVLNDARAVYSGSTVAIGDVSIGGIFVCTPIPPLRGTSIKLTLAFDSGNSIDVSGIVIWTNSGQERRSQRLPEGFGFQIRRVSLEDKLRLIDRIKQAELHGDKLARPRVDKPDRNEA
jgi:hypothetical protein